MSPPRNTRTATAIVILALLAAPALFWGAAKAIGSNSNRVLDWLPQSFEETQRLLWFVQRFGSDEILVVGWDGCDLADERLDAFVASLGEPTETPEGDLPVFHEVISGRDVLRQLMEPPLSLPRELAKARMSGWLLGRDDQTCVIARIQPLPSGEYNRQLCVRYAREIAQRLKIPEPELHIAGPTADSVAVDEAGQQWTLEMGAASTIIGFLLAWLFLRQWWQVFGILATAIVSAAASLAVVHFSGHSMDSVLMTMPALVFVLATSGGIHLTHYYREASHQQIGRASAARAAHRPGALCAGLHYDHDRTRLTVS